MHQPLIATDQAQDSLWLAPGKKPALSKLTNVSVHVLLTHRHPRTATQCVLLTAKAERKQNRLSSCRGTETWPPLVAVPQRAAKPPMLGLVVIRHRRWIAGPRTVPRWPGRSRVDLRAARCLETPRCAGFRLHSAPVSSRTPEWGGRAAALSCQAVTPPPAAVLLTPGSGGVCTLASVSGFAARTCEHRSRPAALCGVFCFFAVQQCHSRACGMLPRTSLSRLADAEAA